MKSGGFSQEVGVIGFGVPKQHFPIVLLLLASVAAEQ